MKLSDDSLITFYNLISDEIQRVQKEYDSYQDLKFSELRRGKDDSAQLASSKEEGANSRLKKLIDIREELESYIWETSRTFVR